MSASTRHFILLPSYNTGPKLVDTVTRVMEAGVKDAQGQLIPVWVVIDGSQDGSDRALAEQMSAVPHFRLLMRQENSGKGAAIEYGSRKALEEGFTHVLTMDADGQHPVEDLKSFIELSEKNAECLILGKPVFDDDAPLVRVWGRKVSNFWANLETLWVGIDDSLYGLRVYPLQPLIQVFDETRYARRFDFDPEMAVRLCWKGVVPLNLPSRVKYFKKEEGGVSQFRYVRDNSLLSWMHTRLFFGFLLRLPSLILRKFRVKSTH